MGTFQNPTTGEISNITDVTLLASASRTASANGAAVAIGDLGTLRLLLDVTVDNGTTLDVTIETSYDGSTAWRSLGAFAQVSGVGSERKSFPGCDRYARAVSTIVGTAWTYSVTGEAV
jgi:hypothetical protein